MDCILWSVKIVYIYNAIKMPSIIIAYLVMLHLDCVIEVTCWGILRIEFYLFYFYTVDLSSVCLVGTAS